MADRRLGLSISLSIANKQSLVDLLLQIEKLKSVEIPPVVFDATGAAANFRSIGQALKDLAASFDGLDDGLEPVLDGLGAIGEELDAIGAKIKALPPIDIPTPEIPQFSDPEPEESPATESPRFGGDTGRATQDAIALAQALRTSYEEAVKLSEALNLPTNDIIGAISAIQQLEAIDLPLADQFNQLESALGITIEQFNQLRQVAGFDLPAPDVDAFAEAQKQAVALAQALGISAKEAAELKEELDLPSDTIAAAVARIRQLSAVKLDLPAQVKLLNSELGISGEQFKKINSIARGVEAPKAGFASLASSVAGVAFGFNNVIGAVQNLAAAARPAYEFLIGSNEKLNAQLLSSQTNLASSTTISRGGQEITDPTEKINASRASLNKALKQIEVDTQNLVGVTSAEVNDLFQITLTNAASLNKQSKEFPGPIEAATSLTKGWAASLKVIGIPLFQANQEINSILKGQIDNNSILAQNLDISKEQVGQWKGQGRLVDELNKRLQVFVSGNAIAANSVEGITSNIQDLFERLGREAGKPLQEAFTKALADVYPLINAAAPGITEAFKNIVTQAVEVFKGIGSAIAPLTPGIGLLAQAFASLAQTGIEVFTSTVQILVGVLGAMTQAIGPVLTTIGLLAKGFADFAATDFGKIVLQVGLLAAGLAILGPVIVGIGGAIATFATVALPAAIAGLGAAAAAAATAAAPFVLAAAAIAGLGFALYKLAPAFDPLVKGFQDLFGRAMVAIGPAIEAIKKAFSSLGDGFGAILDKVGPVVETLIGVYINTIQRSFEALAPVGKAIGDVFLQLVGAISGFVTSAVGGFDSLGKATEGDFAAGLDGFLNALVNGAQLVGDFIVGAITGFVNLGMAIANSPITQALVNIGKTILSLQINALINQVKLLWNVSTTGIKLIVDGIVALASQLQNSPVGKIVGALIGQLNKLAEAPPKIKAPDAPDLTGIAEAYNSLGKQISKSLGELTGAKDNGAATKAAEDIIKTTQEQIAQGVVSIEQGQNQLSAVINNPKVSDAIKKQAADLSKGLSASGGKTNDLAKNAAAAAAELNKAGEGFADYDSKIKAAQKVLSEDIVDPVAATKAADSIVAATKAAFEGKLITAEQAKTQIDAVLKNTSVDASVKDKANQLNADVAKLAASGKAASDQQVAALQRAGQAIGENAGGLEFGARKLEKLGTIQEQLAKQFAAAQQSFNDGSGGDAAQYQKDAQAIIDLTQKQLQYGAITQAEAAKRLAALQSNTQLEVNTQIKARDAIRKASEDASKLEIEGIKGQIADAEAARAKGLGDEIEAAKKITELKLQENAKQLELNKQLQKDAVGPEKSKLLNEEKQLQLDRVKIETDGAKQVAEVRKNQQQLVIDGIKTQQSELQAAIADGTRGEADAQKEVTALTIKESEARIKQLEIEQEAENNPTKKKQIGEQIKQQRTEITKANAEARKKEQSERLKDFDEQSAQLKSNLARGLVDRATYNKQISAIQNNQVAEEEKQLKEALGRIAAGDKEGREAINAKLSELANKRVEIAKESYDRELRLIDEFAGQAADKIRDTDLAAQIKIATVEEGGADPQKVEKLKLDATKNRIAAELALERDKLSRLQALPPLTDPEAEAARLDKIRDQSNAVEQKRLEQINNRKDAEQAAIGAITKANEEANRKLEQATQARIVAVKQAELDAQKAPGADLEAAARLAAAKELAIRRESLDAEYALKQEQLAKLKALGSSGNAETKAQAQQLEQELGQLTLDRIDAEKQALEELRKERVRLIELERQDANAPLERRIELLTQAKDLISEQNGLIDAQSRLSGAIFDQDQQRSKFAAEDARSRGDLVAAAQIEAQAAQSNLANVARENQLRLVKLELSQRQREQDAESAVLTAQIAQIEARASLAKAEAEGRSARELQSLREVLSLRGEQVGISQRKQSGVAETNALEKQATVVENQTKLEGAQNGVQKAAEAIGKAVQEQSKKAAEAQKSKDGASAGSGAASGGGTSSSGGGFGSGKSSAPVPVAVQITPEQAKFQQQQVEILKQALNLGGKTTPDGKATTPTTPGATPTTAPTQRPIGQTPKAPTTALPSPPPGTDALRVAALEAAKAIDALTLSATKAAAKPVSVKPSADGKVSTEPKRLGTTTPSATGTTQPTPASATGAPKTPVASQDGGGAAPKPPAVSQGGGVAPKAPSLGTDALRVAALEAAKAIDALTLSATKAVVKPAADGKPAPQGPGLVPTSTNPAVAQSSVPTQGTANAVGVQQTPLNPIAAAPRPIAPTVAAAPTATSPDPSVTAAMDSLKTAVIAVAQSIAGMSQAIGLFVSKLSTARPGTPPATIPAKPAAALPKREKGGPVAAGEAFVGSERGQELVRYDDGGYGLLPATKPTVYTLDKPGTVIPAGETAAMMQQPLTPGRLSRPGVWVVNREANQLTNISQRPTIGQPPSQNVSISNDGVIAAIERQNLILHRMAGNPPTMPITVQYGAPASPQSEEFFRGLRGMMQRV